MVAALTQEAFSDRRYAYEGGIKVNKGIIRISALRIRRRCRVPDCSKARLISAIVR